jgi:hypothetical protein
LAVAGSNNDLEEVHMRSRFTKLGVTIAALASLAVGGSAIATAAQKGGASAPTVPAITTPAQAETPSATDGDNVQQGDQSAPDAQGSAAESAAESATSAEKPDAAETPGSEVDANDGPGGHADSSANADTQQEGAN